MQRQFLDPTLWERDHQTRPLKAEVTMPVIKSSHETPLYKVDSLPASSQAQSLPERRWPRRARASLALGTERSSSCAAHPALAEHVPAAALGLDIEGGTHWRPASADPSGSDPDSEAAPSRCSGSEAAQPSGAQHRVPRAVPSSPRDPYSRAPAFARSERFAFPRQRLTPPHVTAPLPCWGKGSGRGHVDIQRERASLPDLLGRRRDVAPPVSRVRNG
ncbi:hypothetical protein P7K49_012309 [Saguinus oedipus]|uniref:Uncharacterized protein n=1 Tax=Saguinus oedipus TaxID=9490 RepID=A0ABQ9VT63_SAGOE|nr:hypothetical protein P7K49_012309 [Saguinus oedipus]